VDIKTCFAMVITSNYFPMAQVALRSLRLNSGLGDIPCYVFCFDRNDHYWSIDSRLDELMVLYDNKLIVQRVDAKKYAQHGKVWPGYWSHEMFNIKGYDRVIFTDADIICLGSLTSVPVVDLGMVWEEPRNQFFVGFVVVGKKYLNTETYEAVLKHQKKPETWGRDQAVYNEYFRKDEVTELDLKYNTVTNKKSDDIRMLHYIYKSGSGQLSPEYQKLWRVHALAVDAELKGAGVFRWHCR